MACPYCVHGESKVVDKRDADHGFLTRRRRECVKCEKRFTTYERIETDLRVVKKEGKREQFDREKMKAGMLKACEKRPIASEAIDESLNRIEAVLKSKASTEIHSEVIGELVGKELKKLDKVAYIRFASVYKDFEDVETFAMEINKLMGNRRMPVIKTKK